MEMQNHIYKIIEITGSSETSVEDAIQRAIARASRTLNHLRWFEVIQTRGHIENGKVHHYQVTLKVGFTLEDFLPVPTGNLIRLASSIELGDVAKCRTASPDRANRECCVSPA